VTRVVGLGLILSGCGADPTTSGSGASALDDDEDNGPYVVEDTSVPVAEAPRFEGEYALSEARSRLYSSEGGQHAARTVAAGDLDGDGVDELVATTVYADVYDGGAWVLDSLPAGEGTFDEHGLRIHGSIDARGTGRAVAVADVDGDGLDDVLLGAPYGTPSKVCLLLSPVSAGTLPGLADGVLYGEGEDYAGHGLALADLTGDGAAELVVGAYNSDVADLDSGTIYVVDGSAALDTGHLAELARSSIYGRSRAGAAGRFVRAGGDFDGDGVGDIFIPSYLDSSFLDEAGAAHVVLGPAEGERSLDDADATLQGDVEALWLGLDLTHGDLDGDGRAELIVGARGPAVSWRGGIYARLGGAMGVTLAEDADILISGEGEQLLGHGLDAADLDEDGRAELLAGAMFDEGASGQVGAAYLFAGLEPGTATPADAVARFEGESDGSHAGLGLATGDFDGDGWLDLAIGAPLEPWGSDPAGALYLVFAGD